VDACFEAYDRDGSLCLELDECALQAPLTSCSSPEWDLDGDGCINQSVEWPAVYALTNGSVCPVTTNNEQQECDPGYYLDGTPVSCIQCIGGSTRRRRSLECTDCEAGYFDAGDYDDCVCQADVVLEAASTPSGSTTFQVSATSILVVGDNVTIAAVSGNSGGPPTDEEEGSVELSYEYAVIESITGLQITIASPLVHTYAKYSSVMLTCTTMDGTEISRQHSPSCGGEETCRCGTEACSQTEMCSMSADGTGTCVAVGPYPIHPTPAPTVGAKGDPHLVNLAGEHFDINHGGDFTLLRIPQDPAGSVEVQLQATIQPEFKRPCTTYITRVEIAGSWLGNATVQVRSFLRSHPGYVEGARLGARLLPPGGVAEEVPWQSIEDFLPEATEVELSAPGSDYRVTLSKSQWFPKKEVVAGAPNVAGMFTLSMRHEFGNPQGSKILIRQDLPEQEHLNLAVQRVSALGRVDVGGLLGFDSHPQNLEYVSGKCQHHRLRNKLRVESQDEQDGAYYYRPLWKDRWSKIKQRRHGGATAEDAHDNEAAATLVGSREASSSSSLLCKCPVTGDPFAEGVVIEEPAARFAAASWD
jgi:hypothetical protein